jgi:hypothetical protein
MSAQDTNDETGEVPRAERRHSAFLEHRNNANDVVLAILLRLSCDRGSFVVRNFSYQALFPLLLSFYSVNAWLGDHPAIVFLPTPSVFSTAF